ncbi:hypothetical protein RvY_07265-2 [Ramazzottius varieornatus]|uniref:Uncharacterized protein n=2 Tax=Ramazzottius varieornatus TaxID=947166 RepID=A0A1D1V1F6_RAMVA|nr:hypothetical protein RvY_07265-2 [Ramazzottius varieornatus]
MDRNDHLDIVSNSKLQHHSNAVGDQMEKNAATEAMEAMPKGREDALQRVENNITKAATESNKPEDLPSTAGAGIGSGNI